MGVTGSGKSTIGQLLSNVLQCNYIDADDFHSVENKEKMRRGVPLVDEDRIPWLEAVRDAIIDYIIKGEIVIVACSALQRKYREILRSADPEHKPTSCQILSCKNNEALSLSGSSEGLPYTKSLSSRVVFLCLQCSAEIIASRLETRVKEGAHFMSPTLLQSQMDLLQIDDAEGVFNIDATLSPEVIVENIQSKLSDSQLIS
eukprot:Gb_23289 [translate_table: standard]